ncbi:hypothetical protein CR513_14976, partial [Mucuna pruriens]
MISREELQTLIPPQIGCIKKESMTRTLRLNLKELWMDSNLKKPPILNEKFSSMASNMTKLLYSPIKKIYPTTEVTTRPTISSREVGPDGNLKPLSQIEKVLNWQTENPKAQNALLKTLDSKIEKSLRDWKIQMANFNTFL